MSGDRVELEVSNLTVSYNRIPAVHHASFRLGGGRCVAVLGPNGAGKSTLLKAIAGLLPIETGRIQLHGGRLAYVPQRETVDWDFPITVRGLAEMGRYSVLGPWGRFRKSDGDAVDSALDVVGMGDLQNRQIHALSGGQQQRAFLARAIAQGATIYLLDEPLSGLDSGAIERFISALKALASDGKLILASHHDLKSVETIFDEALLLNGELRLTGSAAEVIKSRALEETFRTGIFSGARA